MRPTIEAVVDVNKVEMNLQQSQRVFRRRLLPDVQLKRCASRSQVVGLGGAAIIVAVVAGTVFVVKKTRARGRSPAVAAATASVSPLTAAVPETSSQAEKDGKKPIETSTSAEEPHVEGTEAASPRATPQLNRNSPETTNMQQ